jgi:hypothetical protein
MALVASRVCVDRWEASLLVCQPAAPEAAWSPFEAPPSGDTPLRAVSAEGVVPQGYVSGEQAEAACFASGKRLCAAEEWELACGGPTRTTFPYGSTRERGACNDDGRAVHPVVEAARRTGLPPDRMWYEGMASPLINQLPGTVRPTGASRRCVGEYGIYDLVGNLHEWIEDPSGTFRGGYFMDTRINGEGCSYATTAHGFDYHDYSTGFRCCLDPDPVE